MRNYILSTGKRVLNFQQQSSSSSSSLSSKSFKSNRNNININNCILPCSITSTSTTTSTTTTTTTRSFHAAGITSASAKRPHKTGTNTTKISTLDLALKQIEKSYGRGSIMKFGEKKIEKVEVISTGSMSLDLALGVGGLPKGRIVEVYGPESSGKTTVALHVVAESQKTGGTCVFIDAEHALDPAYAAKIGVNLQDLYISQPDCGEQALDIAETLIKSGNVDCIIVDSVAALVPKAELDGEMGDSHVALQARLMSQAMRRLTAAIARSNCLIIFINQIRQKVGVIFGSNETTPGGNALRFYSSVRLDVRRGSQIKQNAEAMGSKTRVKVVKNKMAPPFQTAEFDMVFNQGIDRYGELIDLGVKFDIVKKSGAWFSMNDPNSVDGIDEPLILGQGRDNAKLFIKENSDLAKQIKTSIMQQSKENDQLALANMIHSSTKSLASQAEDDIIGEPLLIGSDLEIDSMSDSEEVIMEDMPSMIEINPPIVHAMGDDDNYGDNNNNMELSTGKKKNTKKIVLTDIQSVKPMDLTA